MSMLGIADEARAKQGLFHISCEQNTFGSESLERIVFSRLPAKSTEPKCLQKSKIQAQLDDNTSCFRPNNNCALVAEQRQP